MNTLSNVFQLIDGERDYEDLRWPNHRHNVSAFLTYIDRYLRIAGEADSTISQHNEAHYRYARGAMRKIAALAVACMEQNGVVYRWPRRDLRQFVERSLGLRPARIECRLGEVERNFVYTAIIQELQHQHWEGVNRQHDFSESLTLLRHYLRAAEDTWATTGSSVNTLEIVRMIGAVAVRCLELHHTPPREMPAKVSIA